MKILVTNYTFDASAKTITFGDYGSITLDSVLVITNVTDNVIIYNFADPTKGGSVATNVLTLVYDTTSMSDTDDLQIFYEDTTQDFTNDSTNGTLVNLGANNDVTVASLPLPTGASTSAKQDTIIGHLDGVEALLTTIDADTSALAGTVSGTEVQVDIVAPLPAGTNNIGDVDVLSLPALPAGNNNIGDVDIASIAAGDNNIGNVDVVTLPSLPAGNNNIGDVDVASSALPTGASTSAKQDTLITSNAAIQTSVELIDDTVGTLGTTTYTEATSKGVLIGAVRRDADTPLANTTNEYSPLITDANGYLKTEVFSGGQNIPVSAASGAFASGSIASGAIASGAIASGAIAAGAIAAGATSIAENEDVASAAADRLVKVAQIRLDTPVANANVSNSGDYTQFIADNFGKTWVSGTYQEDVAHIGGEAVTGNGVRRLDTPASSAGTSGDWATMDASAEGAVYVTTIPTTAGGLSVANFNTGDTYTALTNSAQVIKASAGNMYGYYIYNPNAAATYVMIYNIAAASVTVGTSTALMVLCIPPTAAANLMFTHPITFSNAGWSIAAATTGGGNSAPATALEAMIWYK